MRPRMTNLICKVSEIFRPKSIASPVLHLQSILGSTIPYPDPSAIYNNTRRGRLDLNIWTFEVFKHLHQPGSCQLWHPTSIHFSFQITWPEILQLKTKKYPLRCQPYLQSLFSITWTLVAWVEERLSGKYDALPLLVAPLTRRSQIVLERCRCWFRRHPLCLWWYLACNQCRTQSKGHYGYRTGSNTRVQWYSFGTGLSSFSCLCVCFSIGDTNIVSSTCQSCAF